MGALLSIKKALKPIGLYNLGADTLINAELSAYAAGIDFLNEKIEELEMECYISTAMTYGLDMRERLFGYTKRGLIDNSRREILLKRNAITVNDFTKSRIEQAINACGIECTIVENTSYGEFFVNCTNVLDTTKTQEQLVQIAQSFLPAHLTAQFDFGNQTWETIEARDMTFSELDAEDLTWQQLDSY